MTVRIHQSGDDLSRDRRVAVEYDGSDGYIHYDGKGPGTTDVQLFSPGKRQRI